jgi:hypothetical protein
MTATQHYTVGDHVLIAAATLPQPFSFADLVVACYKQAPLTFALVGHPQHPNSHRLAMEIMGKKKNGPTGLGFMQRVAPNTYRLTESGLRTAERLLNGQSRAPQEYEAMTRVFEEPIFQLWRLTQEKPPGNPFGKSVGRLRSELLPAAGTAVRSRNGGRNGRPYTAAEVGEVLAFLEVCNGKK